MIGIYVWSRSDKKGESMWYAYACLSVESSLGLGLALAGLVVSQQGRQRAIQVATTFLRRREVVKKKKKKQKRDAGCRSMAADRLVR